MTFENPNSSYAWTSPVGCFHLAIDTVTCTVRRINLRYDRIATRLCRQRIRKRHPFLRLETETKEECRFTLPTRVAQQVSDNLRLIDTQSMGIWQLHWQLSNNQHPPIVQR